MSSFFTGSYSDTCTALMNEINRLDARIQVSEKNKKIYDEYTATNERLERSTAVCNSLLAEMKPLISVTQQYISDKRNSSMQDINNALRLAGEIIPESTEGIYFCLDGDEAWLSTPDSMEVDSVEGGGYRQISSTFIRSVLLETMFDRLHTLMLDELFSLVSPANSAVLSLYLNVMCQNMSVISIEQKPQVYSNINHRVYKFSKNGNYTSVTMEDVERQKE